jgi:Conserved protein/domain typically associated with flavoprotein oxygenases, DIM6/NTAB family
VAAHFARGAPPIVLWDGVAMRDGVTGAPLLADALAWIECRIWAEHPTGDHTIFRRRGRRARTRRPGPALAYREHGYHAV